MLRVTGIGHSYGDVVIDNKFIEDLNIGTTDQWISEKIGIKTRRVTLPKDYIEKTRNSNPCETITRRTKSWMDLSYEAISLALQRSGISSKDIGLLIVDCVTPDFFYPSPSITLRNFLGINCLAVDFTTACPAAALHGFLCSRFSISALPNYVLCVTSATVSHSVNYNDRTDCAIWGDGAAAMVLSKNSDSGLKIIHSSFNSDPLRANSVIIERAGYFKQEGRSVRNFSVLQTVRMVREVANIHHLDFTKDVFIGHQANKTMLDQICQACGIPEENHWSNVVYCGNQAGAGALASLSENWNNIRKGQKILIAVLGAGLSWGTLLLEA